MPASKQQDTRVKFAPFSVSAFWAPMAAQPAALSSSVVSAEQWRVELARSYRPILQNFVLPCSLFYAAFVFVHAIHEPFDHFVALGSAAAAVAIFGGFLSLRLRRPNIGYVTLELYALIFFGAVYASLLQYSLSHLDVSKLSLFTLLAMGVAATGVNWSRHNSHSAAKVYPRPEEGIRDDEAPEVFGAVQGQGCA